ncbi:MAG: hypothetical protein QOF48_2114 [Verrucomicrobiota bacterium]|jgi:hypothetical protein
MHEPLSVKLAQIVKHQDSATGITLNELMERTQGRGFYLVIILLSLPFIVPVSIPGVSTILGLTIATLTLRLALGKSARLPRFMGGRKLSPAFREKILGGSVKFLRFIEKGVKPRRTRWLASRWAISANALLMTFMGLLLALPFPPFPPLTNALPCYALILIAVSTMEEDGLMIWAGYAMSVGTTIYLFLVAEGLKIVFMKFLHAVQHWLQ